MECFIKKIFQDSIDEKVHEKFTRFGKGKYEKRAVIRLQKGSRVKVKGSFEFANDFVELVAELQDARFSGVILSREPLGLEKEKKKQGLYSYETEIGSERVKELKDKVYYLLLDSESEDLKLKIKKKLPKPGKSGKEKVDERFCQLEASLKYLPQIKHAFFWDVPEAKKMKVEHEYIISELIMPQGEKDFEQLRLRAKRKGKIIRKLEIDGRQEVREKGFLI